ncbi:MAG: endonuclease domain-containing protein [Prevotella sp.]|jgi:very-short-patch-repair endonuclease|nr:endonuclease domain-containing protein [Prevotella sp.]MBR6997179.1 endonuclease domain-containing protein [Prevotella sp.]
MNYKTAAPDRYQMLKEFARENRRHMTEAESVLWDCLRNNEVGVKFLRQHVIGDYIVDFVSRYGGLIIEVDGGYHSEPKQQESDAMREEALERLGFHFLRFSNEEVLYETDRVLDEIKNYFVPSTVPPSTSP